MPRPSSREEVVAAVQDRFHRRGYLRADVVTFGIGYARLNVPGSLWKLYNQPRGRDRGTEPALTEVDPGVDVSLARYDRTHRYTVTFTGRTG